MKFIELTSIYGDKIFLNVYCIECLIQHEKRTQVLLNSGGSYLVTESVSEILGLIKKEVM